MYDFTAERIREKHADEPRDSRFVHTDCDAQEPECEGEPVNVAFSPLCAYHLRKSIVEGLVANNDTYGENKAESIAWAEVFFRSDAGLDYIRRELERGVK